MLTGALIAAGSYFTFQVPTEATTSSNMATALNDINHIVAERPQTPFGHALTFLVVLFCTIGLLVHITYTGYGLAHVPLDLLLNNSRTSTRRSAITTSTSSLLNRGSRRSITTMNMDDVRTELQITREKRRALAAKNATSRDVVGERPNMQHVLVDRKLARALEMEEQALLRRAHSLGDLRRQHWMRRLFKWLVKTLEPFTVAFGVISMVVAVAIVSSVVFAGYVGMN